MFSTNSCRLTKLKMFAIEEKAVERAEIETQLEEIAETIEELENARKVFLEYAENVEFELKI